MSFSSYIARHPHLKSIFGANFFLSFHYYLIIYANSLFLSRFFTTDTLSTLYIIGSAIEVIILLRAPDFVHKFGMFRLLIATFFLEFVAILSMAVNFGPLPSAIAFIVHQGLIMMLYYLLDIYLETFLKTETHTGFVRGTYLTVANVILVLSPALTFYILDSGRSFSFLYTLSALVLGPIFFIAAGNWKRIKAEPRQTEIEETVKALSKHPDVLGISMARMALECFYAFMVIYMPLYLENTIGFSEKTLGLIFTVMLLPFVLLSIPVGEIADKKLGEKEFLIAGFFIMAISVAFMPFLKVASAIGWAALLFASRVGAATVETSTESYFFKQVKGRDAHVISFYRMVRPMAFIIMPIVVTLTYKFLDVKSAFFLVSTIMIFGMGYILDIKDSK